MVPEPEPRNILKAAPVADLRFSILQYTPKSTPTRSVLGA